MMSPSDVRTLVLDLLEEQTVLIGTLTAIHEVEEEFLWRLFRGFDSIRLKYVERTEDRAFELRPQPQERSGCVPHPAVEEFLSRLRRL